MQWFEGGIADAVTLSRKNSSIFVVYIEGNDEKSKHLTEIINDPGVSQIMQSNHFVAVKVTADSVSHQQFTEIYKRTSTPSIYFIGKTGAPLDILTDVKDVTQIVGQINNVIIKNGGTPVKVKSENLIKNESVSDGDAKTEPTTSAEVNNTEVTTSPEEKLKLAQELIEKKREEKKTEEEEKEKLKEIERRKMGQDVQKMKRWQQDQELKQIMEERQREKREEQEARDKVKRQIEEDKKEKAAKLAINQPTSHVEQPKPSRPNSDTARLQFRLPDGSTQTHDFPSSSVLQEVINFIKANINLGFTNFILSTTFPRREFGANDASQTLLDLQLVPNAVILILPVSHGAVATNSNSGIMGMIWYLITPIMNFLGYLKGLVFGTPPPTTQTQSQNKKRTTEPDPVEGTSKPMPKRRAGEAAIRRQGNIHRLTDPDSDEDNNTWNGNSTQQM